MLSIPWIRSILSCAAIGLFALGPPYAGAQEEESQPAGGAEATEPESAPAAEPETPSETPAESPAEAPAETEGTAAPETPAVEEDTGPRPLDEIVVTARKVTESIQDAPLSVVVLDASKMTASAITKVEELVAYVPNIAMSETGIGTNLYVRGIGSGINQGFEQSVGMYIDGIYYGRGQLTRAPFLDIAQVEALRGPQAILLGNNSIAGALNLTTAKPTDTFLASADGLYEPDNNEQEISGVLSGPLTDRLSARFAARYRTMDGYEDNVTLGRDEPNREETSGRLTLAWDGDIWDGTLKYEKNKFNVKGRQIEIIKALPSTAEAVSEGLTSQTGFSRNSGSAQGSANDYWRPGHTYLEYLSTFFGNSSAVPGVFNADTDYLPADPSIGNGTADYTRGSNGDKSDNDIDAVILTLNFDIGDYQLTSITGYLKYTYTEICDCDFTGAPQFNLLSTEKYDQWSQEFRIASPTSDRLHWLAGVYYQDDTLNFGDQIFLPLDDPYRSGVVRLVGYATTGNDQGANDSLGDTSAFRNFDQNDYVSSVFAQVGLDITDRWRASLGTRYTHMEKEASRILREGDLNRVPFDLNTPEGYDRLSQGALLFSSIFKVAFHQLSGSRIENNTAFEFVTDFDLTDDVMLYASYKTGFKSGGFDARSNSEPIPGSTGAGSLYPASLQQTVVNNAPPGSFEFEDEQAKAYEAGSKIKLLNDTAEINIALFHTKFDNLQVSIFDGTLGFNVGNAASATSEGMELDGRWAITDDWFLTGSIGYLHFNFDDFKNGQCNQGQVPTYPANLPPEDPNYAFRGKCDYTDKRNQYVADWSGTVGLKYEHPLGDNLLFRSGLDVLFTDHYNPSQNLDSRVEQAGYAEFNLRLALANPDDRWEVAVLGRNLGDESVVSYANDTPLAFSQFGSPTYYGFMDQGRNVALQASYKFGD